MKITQLTRFGTKGFMSLLLAAQIAALPAMAADSTADRADRASVDAKKSARSVKRDMKKTGRNLTGQGNTWDDMKDGAKDGVHNAKDEAGYQKRKAERKSR